MVDVISVVANILQLVDFGLKIHKRLSEYGAKTADIPEALLHINARLEPLQDVVQRLDEAMKTGAMDKRSSDALWTSLHNCEVQIRQLVKIIDKCLPPPGSSGFKRKYTALNSFRYDKRVKQIDEELRKYMESLNLHITSRTYLSSIGMLTFFPGFSRGDIACVYNLVLKNPLYSILTCTERPPPPKPSTTVPLRRDPYFVDRSAIMSQIESKCTIPAARIALVGIGGVG